MTKKYLLNRNLANQYIKEIIPQLISFLESEAKDKEKIVDLSYRIRAIFKSVEFEKQKKDYIATINFEKTIRTACMISSDYDIHTKDVVNILFSPFIPKIELTDDSITLLESIDETFGGEYFSFSMMRKELKIPYKTVNDKELKKLYDNLVENGLIAVSGDKSSLVYTFLSPYTPLEEDSPEEGEWYIDENNTLQYGEKPYLGTLAKLAKAFAKAEEDYNKWWEPIEKENERLMEIFEKDIENLKIQSKSNYLSDINWFLYSYFYRETIASIHDASKNIIDFFRYYICKCPGHSEYLVKRMMTTIKRFYTVMYRNGEVTEEECERVIVNMKDNSYWILEAATDFEKRREYFSLWC